LNIGGIDLFNPHNQHQLMSKNQLKNLTSTTAAAANMLQQQHQTHNIFGEGGLGTQPDAAGLAVLIASNNNNLNHHLYHQNWSAEQLKFLDDLLSMVAAKEKSHQ
jgi:hypothetical protein